MQPIKIKDQTLEQLFTKNFPVKVKQLTNTLKSLRESWDLHLFQDFMAQVKSLSMLSEALHLIQIHHHCQYLLEFLQEIEALKTAPDDEAFMILQAQIEILSHALELNKLPLHFNKETLKQLNYHTKIILGMSANDLSLEFTEQFSFFGYKILPAQNLEVLKKQVLQEEHLLTFAAIIIDLRFCPNLDIKDFDDMPSNLPVIFLSEQDTIENRLFAVRAGGQAFFTLPVEFSTLLEKIDDLIVPIGESSPYRVLIIEDSKTQANHIKHCLEQAGIIVSVVTDPLAIQKPLQDFKPELILMDLYMPKCSGIELARVIRQQESHMSIPIVYLSSESDLNIQMNAMRLGGDDFLTKPIEEEHLMTAVTNRIERSRTLRTEMIQDSLTGLLNHTRILEQLETEVLRAQREETALSFVMIDIDNFKNINDKYGHPMGDKVLKSLSRLFKQRFRRSDSVGRYGGEEFVAILPHSDAQSIFSLIEEMRDAFSQVVFQTETGEEFNVTISTGIAELRPEMKGKTELVHAADKALYTAKRNGRNQTIIAKF